MLPVKSRLASFVHFGALRNLDFDVGKKDIYEEKELSAVVEERTPFETSGPRQRLIMDLTSTLSTHAEFPREAKVRFRV